MGDPAIHDMDPADTVLDRIDAVAQLWQHTAADHTLMDQAIAHGMMIALLTGGEAMTHPDFRKIYMYLIEQGISVRVKTNGIMLNKEAIDLFTEYPPYGVDVSLYGCDEESYSAVTGHDVFRTVSDNIRAAMKAGLHLRIMITPSSWRSSSSGFRS